MNLLSGPDENFFPHLERAKLLLGLLPCDSIEVESTKRIANYLVRVLKILVSSPNSMIDWDRAITGHRTSRCQWTHIYHSSTAPKSTNR